jgi:hypothetical protein
LPLELPMNLVGKRSVKVVRDYELVLAQAKRAGISERRDNRPQFGHGTTATYNQEMLAGFNTVQKVGGILPKLFQTYSTHINIITCPSPLEN